MEGESYTISNTSHLLGSVPAVIDEKSSSARNVPYASMQTFPLTNGVDKGQGYQISGTPTAFGQQPTSYWVRIFSVSSYMQYFNVDTDVVVNRLLSSLNPVGGDFFNKIDANPDLYGLIWISTTLVFVLALLGNIATYLTQKHVDNTTSWSFDVSFVNTAAWCIYGYVIVVPLAYYFFLQYMGSNANLIRFWCMWGIPSPFLLSPLFISQQFIEHEMRNSSNTLSNISNTGEFFQFLLLVPVGILRWIIMILIGVASASFVALNLRSFIEGNDVSVAVIAAFFLQIALAVFIKVRFFA